MGRPKLINTIKAHSFEAAPPMGQHYYLPKKLRNVISSAALPDLVDLIIFTLAFTYLVAKFNAIVDDLNRCLFTACL